MKIALIGYGKMGQAIETLALSAGHSIHGRIHSNSIVEREIEGADVAIEFTNPESAKSNILHCFEANIPVVVGTTGWYSHFDELKNLATSGGHSLFYATNFSLGVNLFFELNKKLAALMNPHLMYEPTMDEIHHIHKKDAPSGTAITLAEGILANLDRKKSWINRLDENKPNSHAFDLEIRSIRENDVPGTHTITYKSEIDEVSITHQALNRTGFALGAIKAAEWLYGKTGVYTMTDLLGFEKLIR